MNPQAPAADAVLAAIVAELRQQTAILREIRADLSKRAAADPLADRLLRAVRGVLAAEPFTAPALCRLADSPLSTRAELRAVIEDVCRCAVTDVGAARRLGGFLAENSQHQVDGLQLVSVGKERAGLVYRVEVATETRAPFNPWPQST